MSYKSLHDRLRTDIAKKLLEELKIENLYALPKIDKIIVNVGINKTKMDSKEMHEYIRETLGKITGQRPVMRATRKAISNFKTREGSIVGAMVTLRGRRMEEFLDRLLSFVLPRIRDFRGLPDKLDGRGSYALGLKDHTIFPEVPAVDASKIFGMQIQITTTAGSDKAGKAFFKALGMPFAPEKPARKGNPTSPARLRGAREEKEEIEGKEAKESVDSSKKSSDT